jgi:hypothetical protein
MTASEAAKPRSLTAEEAETWIGLLHTNKGHLKPGDKNDPIYVGFAVQGPVILLGTPEDNPLIKFLKEQRFLPYDARKDEFPGPGHGLIAWQRDGVGVMQESITLIAHDAEGMAEAVGNLYEIAAGIDPLTPLTMPRKNAIVAGGKAGPVPAAKFAWTVILPDRIRGLKTADGKLRVLTHAQIAAEIDADGKLLSQKLLDAAAYQKEASNAKTVSKDVTLFEAKNRALPQRRVKFAVPNGDRAAVAYWGGMLRITDGKGMVLAEAKMPQDVTAMAWSGERLIVGDADGRLMALTAK